MNTQEIVKEVQNLPIPEQREILRLLSHNLEAADNPARTSAATDDESYLEARKQRMEWLKANRKEYAGQYVALDQRGKLAGSGATFREAAEAAKKNNFDKAFVVYVYPLDYVGEIGTW